MALRNSGQRLAATFGIAYMALTNSDAVQAQGAANWPTKPIELVALNAPGGASDVFARTLATAARDTSSQPIVVVNKPGGRGAT